MSFKKNDSVKFSGDLDMAPLEQTVVAHVDEAKHQIIIEHPNGHLGAEFTRLPLDPRKRYTYVKPADITLIGRPDTIETIVAEAVVEVNGESKVRPLSEVLAALKASRPEDDHEMLDGMISEAEYEEKSRDRETVEYQQQEAIKAEEKRRKEALATEQKEAQDRAIRADAAVKEAKLDDETKERMINQEKEIQLLIETVNLLEKYGVIFFNEQTRVYWMNGAALNILVNEATDRKRAIANYMQNTPDDLEILKAEAAKLFELEQNGKLVDAPEPKATEHTPAAETNDYKAKVAAENEKVRSEREAKKVNTKPEPTAETTKEVQPETPTPAEKPTKGEAPADNATGEFFEKLVSLESIGKKAAEKIIAAYPTPKLLMAAIKDKSIVTTDKVRESLVRASKTKWFKERA